MIIFSIKNLKKQINKSKDVKTDQILLFNLSSLGVIDMESNHIKSIFQNGAIAKEEYTCVWIDIINRLEKNKGAIFSPKM